MVDRRPKVDIKRVDTKEFEFPETVFVRDIDNRVFQGIVFQVLSQIDGIALAGGNFIDNLLGTESIKGIQAEQDMNNHTIRIKVEINICYGISIPEKAEEIQTKITEEVTKITGLHVSNVHVVFKNVIPEDAEKRLIRALPPDVPQTKNIQEAEEYSDEF